MYYKHCILAFSFCAAFVGCAKSPPVVEIDPEKATASLRIVLDAWKKGATPDSLLNQSPPIEANDWEWQSGWKLTDYEIFVNETQSTHPVLCRVKLSVVGPKGETVAKAGKYEIETAPKIVVHRADE